MKQSDILIIGAGPGGSTAAWALAQAGQRVLLIDQAQFPREKTCGDGLSPMSIDIMREIGVLDRVLEAGAWRLDYVRIDGPRGDSVRLKLAEYINPDTFALVLPRLIFDEVVRQYALEAGADFMGGVRVRALHREGERITRVEAEGPDGPLTFEPGHVILAVGANMGLLKRAGLLQHEPQLVRASRAYYEGTEPITDSYTFFYEQDLMPGYGWIFPTGNGSANIGVGTMPTIWGQKAQPTGTLLERFIERRIADGTLSDVRRVTPVKGYPLRIDFRKQQVAGENWLLLGEAAGLVNPVTGEGIDMAMESALIAAEAMQQGLAGAGYRTLYTRRLRQRFLNQFRGLHLVREGLINPLMINRFVRQMNAYHFVGKTVIQIALGYVPPRKALHPRFLTQLLAPFSASKRQATAR